MRRSILCSLILCTTTVTGCVVLRSTPKPHGEMAAGLTYYLPKREIKLTVDRKLLKRDSLQKVIAAKTAELAVAAAASVTVNGVVVTARGRLASASVQGNEDARRTVSRELDIALADSATARRKTLSIDSTIKATEVDLTALASAAGSSCVFAYSAAIEMLAPVADGRQRFVVNTAHSPFRDDNVKLTVNNAGLLSTANLVAHDRTGDIVVDAAGAIAGMRAPASVKALSFGNTIPGDATTPPCGQLPTRFSQRLDPTDEGAVKSLNDALRAREFPYQLEVPRMAAPRTAGDTASVALLPTSLSVQDRGLNGVLFYRTALPQTMVLRQCNVGTRCEIDASSTPVEASVIMLPQVGPLSYIPMRSSFLVKTTDDVVFENGMITSWSATRPSELAEAVRLPVRILKSVVSVPAELVKLRIDLADQQKGLAASQQAQIEAQARLARIQACVDAAGDDRESALQCFKQD